MAVKVEYNSRNIAETSEFNSIIVYDRLGGMFDNLSVSIPKGYKPEEMQDIQKGDTIKADTGGYSSGVMYIDEYSMDDSTFTINALSCVPNTKSPKSRIWRNVQLSEVITDVAKNYGLTVKAYGITDYTYECIVQFNETDLQMLDRLCTREGYAIKTDDDCLIVFDEYTIEHESEPIVIDVEDVRQRYSFSDSGKSAHSFTVACYTAKGLISQTFYDETCSTSGDRKRIEYVSEIGEAQRFARGYLRNINKYRITGNLSMNINPEISAGTVVELTGFDEYNGTYIVYEVSHDIVNKITRLKVRGIVEF